MSSGPSRPRPDAQPDPMPSRPPGSDLVTDPGLASDPELALWLERSEAIGFGREAYQAAADRRGNPAGAVTALIDGAVASALTAIDMAFFNRVVGLGIERPATEDDVEAASRFFLDHGRTESMLQVAPTAQPDELAAWMGARGYRPGGRWVKMWRTLDDLPESRSSLRIERITPALTDTFEDICQQGFGLPPVTNPICGGPIGRHGWSHYLGYDGDLPVSTAAMFVIDGVAWLGYAATLEAHRGRGGQSAMFAARLRDARALGCRWAVTETGAESEQRPVNHSYRNMVRMGFRLAYARPNWIRAPEA